MTANGTGRFDSDLRANQNGVLIYVGMDTDLIYTVTKDGRMIWDSPDAPGVDLYAGGISRNGSLAVLGAVRSGSRPGFAVLVRRSAGFTPGSLAGTWNVCGFSNDHAAPDSGGNVGRVTFDGFGGWTSQTWWNVDGEIIPMADGAGTYAVDANGSCRIRFPGTGEVVGTVHPGGAFLAASGGAADGTSPTVYVFVRRAEGASAAILTGTYAIAGLEYDPAEGGFVSRAGTLVANGAGGFTATITRNEQGTILPVEEATGTYAIGPDGAMTLTSDGGETLQGGISPDGAYGVVGGSQGTLTPPCLHVFLRR